jgi:glutathione synthase/RimK-type ligase-like ATP-grasp enzyme
MPNIALATSYEYKNLFEDEMPLLAALEKRGVTATPVVWDSPEVSWAAYDLIIVRNIWDYHRQPQTFLAWLAYLESKNLRVYNPISLLRWNMNKQYLARLAEAGIRILPTVFVQHISQNLAQTLIEKGWQEAVAKPLISASGDNTWRINPKNAADYQAQFDFIQGRFGAMIQPYASEIATVGEYSLVFFNGEFSHAVLKRPAPNSLFVHEEHGGRTVPIPVSPEIIAQAKTVLEVAQTLTDVLPLYARVDGFLDGDDFVLMELECIEPELYQLYDESAGERFASVILGLLND